MRSRSLCLLALNVILVGAAVQLAALPVRDRSPQDAGQSAAETEALVALGEELYASECEPCHGNEGKGDGPAARFLDSQPRDLTAGAWQFAQEQTIEALALVITEGIPDTEMEPFDELLDADEIRAVAAYVLANFAPAIEERP